MTVIDVRKDPAARTMTLTAELSATPERVWQLWADPRQLERWWGPPTYPATFVDHDLSPGGRMRYFMTGPEGDRSAGWWRVLSVDAPHALEVEDGFADEEGRPDPDMPTAHLAVAIADAGDGRTRMTLTATFESVEVLERMAAMGWEEGVTLSVGQIDALLREVRR